MDQAADYVSKRKIAFQRRYSKAIRNWEQTDALIHNDYTILSPALYAQGHYEIKPMTAMNLMNLLAAELLPERINVHVEPFSSKEKANADRVETFYMKVLDCYADSLLIDPSFEDLRNLLAYGKACERSLPMEEEMWGTAPIRHGGETSDEWEYRQREYETAKANNFPIQVLPLTPLMYYDDARIYQPRVVMEYGRQYIGDLREVWGENVLGGKDDGDQVEYLSCTDTINKRRIITADGTTIHDVPNVFGNPYTIALSGHGKMDHKGRLEYEQRGLIYDFKAICEEEARWMTAMSVIIQKYAFPQAASDDPMKIKLPQFPGDIGYKPRDVSLEWLDQPHVMQDLWTYMTLIQKQQEQGSRMRLLAGNRVIGVESGHHEGMLLEQAEKTYKPVLEALKRIIEGRLYRIAYYVDKIIREPILRGSKIGPTQLNGYYKCTVEFDVKNILSRRAEIMLVKTLLDGSPVTGPIISRDYAWDLLGMKDKTGMQKQIYIETIFGGQEMQRALTIEASRKRGLGDVIEKGEAESERRGGQQVDEGMPLEEWQSSQLKNLMPLTEKPSVGGTVASEEAVTGVGAE